MITVRLTPEEMRCIYCGIPDYRDCNHLLSETQYNSLQITHLGKSRVEDFGDAASKETYCGAYTDGEAVLNSWSFQTVADHADDRRRPCQDCQRLDGRY